MGNIVWAVIVCLVLLILWVILFDTTRITVATERISDKRIKKPLRAVVLADLHCKRFGRDNTHLLSLIEAQSPDLILIAGDMITAVPGAKTEVAVSLLQKLKEKYPVYYGVGNHEYRMSLYPQTYGEMGKEYAESLEVIGISMLQNTSEVLPDYGIRIYGAVIDKFYYKRFGIKPMDPSYIKEILGEREETSYSILLAHNPDYFPQYASWGADLTLAGHVHGGIARIPFPMPYREKESKDFPKGRKFRLAGVASPNIRFFPEYDGGRFRLGSSTMIVSRGLGTHTIPIRFCNPAELVVLDLTPEE